jgi:hypothetical protein
MIKIVTPNMVINSFIEHYLQFIRVGDFAVNKRKITDDTRAINEVDVDHPELLYGFIKELPVLGKINNGDCGVAAIAIGWVLSQLNQGIDVYYYDNGAHAYFSINGIYYDTVHRFGAKSHREMLGGCKDTYPSMSLSEICEAFIKGDIQGQIMINSFCELWNVPGICLDNLRDDLSIEDIKQEERFLADKRRFSITQVENGVL